MVQEKGQPDYETVERETTMAIYAPLRTLSKGLRSMSTTWRFESILHKGRNCQMSGHGHRSLPYLGSLQTSTLISLCQATSAIHWSIAYLHIPTVQLHMDREPKTP